MLSEGPTGEAGSGTVQTPAPPPRRPRAADQPLAVPPPPPAPAVLLSPPSCTTVPDIQWLKHWCRAAQLQGLVLSTQAAMVGVTPILE